MHNTYETNPCIEHLKQKLQHLRQKPFRTPQTQSAYMHFFEFPVDCDAMMHVLKDSINLKQSELLIKVISNRNFI